MAHRTESAILLYNLAGQHDTVVAVAEQGTWCAMTEPSSASEWKSSGLSSGASFSAASNLVTLATAILDTYEKQFGYSGKNRDTCRRLLELKKAVGLHSESQNLQALQPSKRFASCLWMPNHAEMWSPSHAKQKSSRKWMRTSHATSPRSY